MAEMQDCDKCRGSGQQKARRLEDGWVTCEGCNGKGEVPKPQPKSETGRGRHRRRGRG